MQFRCSKAYKISDEPHEKTCNHTEHDNRSCDNEHLCAYAEKHAFSIVFHCRRHHRVCKSRYRNYRSATCKSADFVVQSERGEQTTEKIIVQLSYIATVFRLFLESPLCTYPRILRLYSKLCRPQQTPKTVSETSVTLANFS